MEQSIQKENRARLKELFITFFDLAPDTAVDDMAQDLQEEWTSVRHLALIMEIETLFGVRFLIDEVTQMRSFEDIENVLFNKKR